MSLTLQPGTPSDLDRVAAFYDDIIDGMAGKPNYPMWQKGIYPTHDFLRSCLREGWYWMLLENGKMVGGMALNHDATDGYEKVPWGVECAPEEVTVVHILGVSPDCQGRGLARELVRGAIRISGEQGQKALRLDVLGGNLPAKKLYESQGFQYRATVELYYEDTGLTDFWMYEYLL